jgi:hypothetical protein
MASIAPKTIDHRNVRLAAPCIPFIAFSFNLLEEPF